MNAGNGVPASVGDAERALMQRLADGDRAAFEAVYRTHVDSVVRRAMARCSDSHDVAEVVAETFLAVWRRAATFDDELGTAAQWIAGIAARKFLDLRRSEARGRAIAARAEGLVDISGVDLDELDDRIDAERLADAAAHAIGRLPKRQRVVFELVAVDGLTVGAAADALGMSPSAVSMRLTRARRALRADLSPAVAGGAPTLPRDGLAATSPGGEV